MPWKDDEYVPCWDVKYPDVWNMNQTVAWFLADCLTAWLDGGVNGYPADLIGRQRPDLHTSDLDANYEDWKLILTKMRDDFRAYVNDDDVNIDETLDLFRKWFYHLWD